MQNWDAHYFVDKELLRFGQTTIVGDAPMFASDIRINQSYMKLWAESWGLGFKHSTKPTQAHNIYRLPVKVVVNMPKKPTKSVYASTEVFMGDREWMPGDKPQPEIETYFQLQHNVAVSGTVSDEGISFKADHYLNYYATRDFIVIDGNTNDGLSISGLGTIPFRSQGSVNDPIPKEGFGGKPDGSIQIHIDQSLDDVEKWERIRYE